MANIVGTGDRDTIYVEGSAMPGSLFGAPRNLINQATNGDDSIDAGDSDDVILSGSGNDTVHGGEGNDTITGTTNVHGSLQPRGAVVVDTDGNAGDAFTVVGDDYMYGDGGDDVISAGYRTVVDGGDGTDKVYLDLGTAWEHWVANTILHTFNELGINVDLSRADTASVNLAVGGLGDMSVTLTDVETFDIHFGRGNDTVTGGANGDFLDGNEGNDLIHGGGGADELDGGSDGDDTLYGDEGNDFVRAGHPGSSYDDRNKDALYGGIGDDVLDGAPGDVFDGGDGTDIVMLHLDTILHNYSIDLDQLTSGGAYNLGDADTAVGYLNEGTRFNGIERVGSLWLGDGNDTVSASADRIYDYRSLPFVNDSGIHLGKGADQLTVMGRIDTSVFQSVDGGAGNDTLTLGGDHSTLLVMGWGSYYNFETVRLLAGSDYSLRLRNPMTLDGSALGSGDNLYIEITSADIQLLAGAGSDTLLGYSGTDSLSGQAGSDSLVGNGGNDTLLGGERWDTLVGGANDDMLDGGLDNDQMYGGTGNDLYYVDNTGDRTYENLNEGNDTVISSISWALSADVETLILTGTAATGTGNGLANAITGNDAANTLSGGGGNDTLDGGAGSDSLDGGSNNDVLLGGARWDTLTGGDGSDTLDGGLDNDQMYGGLGNDVYYVDNVGDRVNESAVVNEGSDTVYAAITWNMTANIEAVVLTGTDNTSSTGNSLYNTMTGNAGNNTLSGGSGHDTLYGMDGNDLLDGGTESDVLYGGNNNDTLVGGQRWDTLDGGAGDDVLNGGTENDRMTGGTGNDSYLVDHVGDRTFELANEGNDTVLSSIDWALSADIEDLILQGTAVSGTGNGLNNRISGTNGANVLDGGNGNDTLSGGAGPDTLIGGTGRDDFVFGAPSPTGADQITDFAHSIDRLVFKGSDYGFAVGHVLTNAQFTLGASAVGTNAQFGWDAAAGHLWWDADGTGIGGLVDLGWFDGAPTVTKEDLIFTA